MKLRSGLATAGSMAALTALLATGAVTGAVASSGSRVVAVDGSASFADRAGDVVPPSYPRMPAITAVDITAITVADATETGTITFTITATGFAFIPTSPVSDHIDIWLNTDKNTSTGRPPTGDDFELEVSRVAGHPTGWRAVSWNGAAMQPIPQSSAITPSFSQNGDIFTWTINKADLAGTTGFAFYVEAGGFDYHANPIGPDLAPNSGTWVYDLSKPPPPPITTAPLVKPLIGPPKTTPSKAAAGRPFTVSFPVTRSDTGARLTSGTMICDPSVNGRVIKHAESFSGGTAKLSFTVPTTARGKLLKVKVTIKVANQSTTRVATFHIS